MSEQNFPVFPASLQQQRLFDLVGLNGIGNYLILKVQTSLDPESIEQGIVGLLEAEENLMTVLVSSSMSKYPMQQVEDTLKMKVHFHQCEDEVEAKTGMKQQRQRPFHKSDTERIRFDFFSYQEGYYWLLLSCSRYISDFNSLRGLAQKLAAFFDGGATPLADEENLQYIDFTEWQHELHLEKGNNGFQYWGNQGASADQFSQIFKALEAEHQPHLLEWNSEDFTLQPELVHSLQEMATSKGVLLEDLLLATWWRLLNQYTPRPFSIVYQHWGRSAEGTEEIFGLFEKYLPLPATLIEKEHSIWGLAKDLAQKKEEQHLRQDYFHYGFDQTSGKRTVFPYQFAYYELPEQLSGTSGNVLWESFSAHADEFVLKLEIVNTQNTVRTGLPVKLYYHSGVFPANWIPELARQFVQQLELELIKVLHGSKQWALEKSQWGLIFQQAMVSESTEEKTTPLHLVELLEKAATQNPDRIAITYEQTTLTYQELNQRSNQLAHFILNKIGNINQAIIAVQLTNPIQMVLSFIAVAKSGNAFLPIDTSNPKARTQFMLEQSEAVLYLSDQEPELADAMDIYVNGKNIEKELANWPATKPELVIDPQFPVYLIFTSGTTGNPKGVLIPHAALVNYLSYFIKRFSITAQDSTVLLSSMAFDLGHTIIWSALSTGANLHLIDQRQNLTFLENINAYLAQHAITYIKCTPSHFKLILGDSAFKSYAAEQKLRLITLGGEHLDAHDLSAYFEHRKGVVIVDEYGPTETTIGVVAQQVDAATIHSFQRLPVIGKPFAGHRIFILDEALNPVLPGEYGAIYITGPGLALGYINQPQITDKAFLSLSFGEENGRRFYASGDLGRWLPDGNIQLAGRIDNQVKIRGYRIEPEEISQVVRQMNGVKMAFTMISRMTSGDHGLRTFVSFEQADLSISEVQAYLATYLPAYMIPDQIFEVPMVPLTKNGKVDQAALTAFAEELLKKETLELPKAEDEKLIAAIWQELLSIDTIGIQQNFFQIGGHSLLAMKMLSRVHKQFNVRIPLVDFFETPTIRALVAMVRTAHQEQFKAIQRITQESNHQGYFDLSMAQQRIWIHEQLKTKDGAYNIYFACLIHGNPNLEKLEHCLNLMVRRHENLRTNFVEFQGQPKQKIHGAESVAFKINLSDQKIYPKEELTNVVIAKCKEGFDLEKDQLFRCIWLNTNDGIPLVIFNFHHIIMDEWSLDIFEKEVTALLSAEGEEMDLILPPLAVQYKDFAAWEQLEMQEERLSRMQLFFESQFAGDLPVLNLKTDYPRPRERSYEGNSMSFQLSRTQHDQILALCQEQDVSSFVFFMAITKVLLYRLSNQLDIILGTLEANRNHPDLENIIGCFFNIIPIRSKFKREDSFADFLKQMKARVSSTLSYALYPFDFLIRDLKIQQQAGRSPLFDVMLTYRDIQKKHGQQEKVGGLVFETFSLPSFYSKYDLLFDFIKEEKSIKLIIEYNTSLFSPATIQEYFQFFQIILNDVLENPLIGLSEIGAAEEPTGKIEDPIDTFFNF